MRVSKGPGPYNYKHHIIQYTVKPYILSLNIFFFFLHFFDSSWLNNLQAEIGRFSHGSSRTDSIINKQTKSFSTSAFLSASGPPLTSDEILNSVKPTVIN